MPPPIEDARAIIANRAAELRAQLAAVPESWTDAVARGGGATLEIGCGHGHFIAAYAQAQPEVPCLAIDILAERLARAQKKLDRAGLRNAVLLRSEARLLLDNLPDWLRLRRVFVLFPDPWPKRRHHKNRLLQPDFLSALARHCVPEARLHFRTDHAPYFAEVQALLHEHPDWVLLDDAPWPFEHETVFQNRAATGYQSCSAQKRRSG
ncbi:hypothetical protein AXK11_08770 [Cephaloticoccus primus]|uniref:tRNA (guanine-N(7)-)-methyltransferase n=1 Tax=Cephaloticoccus primus TaxID=1548207 RepID=A0A139SHV5_9BACT|nr:tRNA (guanosine(46)-N7)-methyltransferase TrmB [Cephaloticoccus primus]KXU34126.1 hypothetical protein AXK11_08770 [Cephaloticoccus primus]